MQFKKILLTFFIGVLTFVFFSCSDEPTSLGIDAVLGEKPNFLEFTQTTDSSSYYFKEIIGLSSSGRLLIGKKDNIEASILIRFSFSLPDSIMAEINSNSLNLLSSTVELNKDYTFGDENASFDYTVHKINSSWSLDFTADSLPSLIYDQNDLSGNKTFSDSLNTFELDNSLVNDWLKAASDTSIPVDNGIIINPIAGTQKVVGFTALNIDLLNIPILKIILEKPGVYVDTLRVISAVDLSVVTGDPPSVTQGNIILQSGLAVNSKIFFDVSQIPIGASLSTAELTFTLDTLETITGNNYTNSLLAYSLIDSTFKDSIDSPILTLSRNANTFTVSSTSLLATVENWIKTGKNEGMVIRPNNEDDGVELFVIKGNNTANVSERPKLKISYTTLK